MSDGTKAAPINLHNGWSFPSLAELAREKLSYGANSPSREFVPGQYRYIRITDIDEYGNLNQDVVGIDFDRGREYELADNDFLFARSGNTVGKTFLFEYEKHGKCAYAGYLIRFRADIAKLDPFYVKHYCQSETYSNWVTSKIRAGAQPNINAKEYGSLRLPLPPLPEQKKIAEILSTWDDAIAANVDLLANSRQRKKALMQRLLTGRTRLPGFEGVWQEKRLKECGAIYSGGTPDTATAQYWDGDINWLTPTDVTALKGRFTHKTVRQISESGLKNSSAKLLPPGSVMVCTRATVGEVAMAAEPICTNQGFKSIVPNSDTSSEFLYYLLSSSKGKMLRLSSGSTFLELSKKDFDNMEFGFPEVEEQKAIASILTTADEEIEALEQRINNLKTQKKALMQQLLTGKRRVKVDEVVQ